MTTLVLGASAGLGRALTEALAATGHDLLLAASDRTDLDAQAHHLRLVYGVRVEVVATDAAEPGVCIEALRAAAARVDGISGLCFALGLSSDDDGGLAPLSLAERLVNVNLLAVIGVAGEFLPAMIDRGKGFVVGFGSVAATRGRRANAVYAAAKRGLRSYFESLRHLTAGTPVRVHFYELGYLATQQAFGRRLLFPPASPEAVARAVVRDLALDRGARYLPRYWAVIARVVAWMPWFVFRRLDF